MSSKYKFLFLILLSLGSFGLLLFLFMQTNYAKNEKDYFNQYPSHEMARRYPPAKTPETTVVLKPLPEIIKAPILLAQKPAIKEENNFEIAPPKPIQKNLVAPKTFTYPKVIKEKPITSPLNDIAVSVTSENKIANLIKEETSSSEQNITPETEKQTTSLHPLTTTIQINGSMAAQLGYEAYDASDYSTAVTRFEQALKHMPNNQNIHKQLAYTHKILGQNEKAVIHFKTAIDHYTDSNAPFQLRREVEQLEDRFNVSGYVIYRGESSTTQQLGADLTQSQAGLEVSYQPKDFGFNNGKKIQFYGRLMSAMESDSLNPNSESLQAGLGARIKPFTHHNLVLSVERLVKLGAFARNDWMLRAGYSRDYNTDYQADKSNWWSYSLYLDAALIKPSDPDIFLTMQATGGYNFPVSKDVIIQPRMTILYSWQKDQFRQASLLEVGPGINLRYYFNDTKYEAYRSHIDLTLEYRAKISGNSIGGSGPVVSLQISF